MTDPQPTDPQPTDLAGWALKYAATGIAVASPHLDEEECAEDEVRSNNVQFRL